MISSVLLGNVVCVFCFHHIIFDTYFHRHPLGHLWFSCYLYVCICKYIYIQIYLSFYACLFCVYLHMK